MSEEKTSYATVLRNLSQNEDEIKEAFLKRVNKPRKKVGKDAIEDLLGDISVIMAFDCDRASVFFSPQSKDMPQEYKLSGLSFEQFIELFRVWLQNEAEKEAEDNPEERYAALERGKSVIGEIFKKMPEGDSQTKIKEPPKESKVHVEPKEQKSPPPKEQKSPQPKDVFVPPKEQLNEQPKDLSPKKSIKFQALPTGEEKEKIKVKIVGALTHQNTRSRMTLPDSPNYVKNRKLLDELMKLHEEDYKSIYRDRLLSSDQDKIAIQDCFVVLQECFYLDQVDLKERIDAPDDFFQSINSYKKIYSLVEQYLYEEKKIDIDDIDIEDLKLSFTELFLLVDYWLRIDNDVILVDNRPKEDKSVRGTLKKTIDNYEKMIAESQNEMEKKILEATVETLKRKLKELETGVIEPEEAGSAQNESTLKGTVESRKRDARRKKALKEIFFFYSTQQINLGSAHTFDKLERLTNTINLGTFRVFLKNFNLKMEHHKLCELYRKAAGVDDNLSYDEFEDLLTKVALRAEITGEPKVVEPKPEVMKEYKPTSYKEDKTYKKFKESDSKRREEHFAVHFADRAKAIYADQVKRDAEKLEEIWEHMGLFNGKYKSRISPVVIPFSSHDKQNFRIPPGSLLYKYRAKALEGKSIEEIQEEVHRRNELRQLVKDLKHVEKSFSKETLQTSRSKDTLDPKPIKQKSNASSSTYSRRYHTKERTKEIPDVKKLTLKKIEGILYGDIRKVDETFNPNDLIDENDDEDNEYLGEYNLHGEKKRLKAQDEAERRKHDEYGKLKKVSKGYAVEGKYGHAFHSQSPNRSKLNIETEVSSAQTNHITTPHGYGNILGNSVNMGLPRAYPSSVRNSKGPTYLDYDLSSQLNSIKQKQKPITYVPSVVNYAGAGASHNNSGYANGGGYGGPSYVGHNGFQVHNYQHMLDRASQIEHDMRRREERVMGNVMNIQQNQRQKAMKVAGKY